jgi:predicted GIY-YIG superfamily endonuclease
MTTNLAHRMKQHGVANVLYAEEYINKTEATAREKQLKRWSREKKRLLINGQIRKLTRR